MKSIVEESLLEILIKYGHLIPSGVKGVYGKGKEMQSLLTNLEIYISKKGRERNTEVMMFPPVMNIQSSETTDYVKSFPHLLGTVNSFYGNEEEYKDLVGKVTEGHNWNKHFSRSEVVMTPAACYPVYAQLSGVLPKEGRTVEVSSYCFRNEPSDEPTRMLSFKMMEYVFAGEPQQVAEWRNHWINKAQEMLLELNLDFTVELADDPFFGKAGKMLKFNQKQAELKYELVVPVNTGQKHTAVISSNYHQDLFATKHRIMTENNEFAHTSCLAFGLERIAIALIKKHGLSIIEWPESLKDLLKLNYDV